MEFLDYIRGKRRGKGAHSWEYEAMKDPFLADAMDGYDSIKGNHADKIAQIQHRISNRIQPRRQSLDAWKIVTAACVLIAFLGGYFALMNHKSTMLVAQQQDNFYINLYIPQNYIDSKRLELTEQRENNPSEKVEAKSIVEIENLHEVIMPMERMTIYIPEVYTQLKQEEFEELPLSKVKKAEIRGSIKSKVKQTDLLLASDKLAAPSKPLAKKEQLKESVQDHESIEILDTKSNYAIAMKEDIQALNAIAVTDYDTLKRSSVKGLLSVTNTKKEIIPEPLIGNKEYEKYLENNLIYPDDIHCKKIHGKVSLEFNIDSLGHPVNISVEKSLCDSHDREAIRLVEEGPEWTLGTSRVKVEVKF